MEHAFEDIEVKQNAMVLLEDALRRKRKKCMIGTGSMSDSYLPLEMELGYTRQGRGADHPDHVGRPALPHPRTQRLPHQRPAGGAAAVPAGGRAHGGVAVPSAALFE